MVRETKKIEEEVDGKEKWRELDMGLIGGGGSVEEANKEQRGYVHQGEQGKSREVI